MTNSAYKKNGASVNGYIGGLIREDMQLSEDSWKAASENETDE